MENEDFRIINHLNNIFKCFRDGRVFRIYKLCKEVLVDVKPHRVMGCKYYYEVSISHKGLTKKVKIHRLLGKAFLGLDIDDVTQVIDHIDRNGLNNSFENLRVTTQCDNMRNKKRSKWDTQTI